MIYDLKGVTQLSFRAAAACLVAGLIAFAPAYLSAQESEDQQQAESQESKEKRLKEHLKAGGAAYSQKEFDKALEHLQAAYDIEARASILFNMGLISEKKGDLEGASEFYRRFIGAPDVGLSARKRASERLAVVNEIIDQGSKADSNQRVTNLMPALEAMNADFEEMGAGESVGEAPEDSQEAKATDKDKQDKQAQQDKQGKQDKQAATTKRKKNKSTATKKSDPVVNSGGGSERVDYGWQPYAAFSVGTGAMIGGVIAMALYNNSVDEAKKTPEETTLHLQHEREASDYLTLSGGMFITGGVVLGLGTYFILAEQAANYKADEAADASSTSVSVGSDYVGVTYSLDF